ncbi:MAG: universal stress protein [Bacteroidetes bacterium]|nr:universal stress protein [Bacteroidota bacterium]
MKKILVPCDFTNTAIQAFRFACEIASKSKGEIFLLHVVELPVLPNSIFVPIQAYETSFVKGIKEKVNKTFESMKVKWGGKIKISLSVEQGSVSSSIKKFVDRKKIDLIVMGTHGSSGLREHMIGSNAAKIVRSSNVPVIAVKKSVKVSSIKNIIYPTILNPPSKELISSIKALQSLFNAQLHILYVNTLVRFSTDLITGSRLDEFVQKSQFKKYTTNIFNDVDEEKGIANFSALFKNKIIVMSTHGRTGIGHLLMRSIAEDVVNHIDCPIWTYARE